MGHLQYPTPLNIDNNTAEGFVNNTIRKKQSKAFDVRFHWMIDYIKKKWVYWEKGDNNMADYFTKQYFPSHHKTIQPKYIHE